MKNIYFCCTLFLAVFVTTNTIHAAVYYPQTVTVRNASTTLLGGSVQPIEITLSDKTAAGDEMMHDIGISREVKTKNITQFQIVSAETISTTDLTKINFRPSVSIPNTVGSNPSDTYVVYVKSYVANNPDSENLIISQPFKIASSSSPSAQLVGSALVLNTGTSFGLKVGPTIYEDGTVPGHATSARLVLGFNANDTFLLKPKIVFKKLRSDAFSYEIPLGDFQIKKGSNTITAQLPTFEYVPGVYQGTIFLNPTDNTIDIIKQVEFQYIVGGPSVTVGQITLASNTPELYTFSIPTFGQPDDLYTPIDLSASSSIQNEKYSTAFYFIDQKGEILHSVVADVDYTQSQYSFTAEAKKVRDAVKVNIKVSQSDKVFFETTQDIDLPLVEKQHVFAWIGLVVFLLGLAWYLLARKKWILIVVTVLAVVFLMANHVLGAPWTPTPSAHQYGVFNSTYDRPLTVVFNEDFSNTPTSCSEAGTDVLIRVQFSKCTNNITELEVGSSRVSMADATANKVLLPYVDNSANRALTGSFNTTRNDGVVITHTFYLYTLPYLKIANIRGPVVANSKLYLRVEQFVKPINNDPNIVVINWQRNFEPIYLQWRYPNGTIRTNPTPSLYNSFVEYQIPLMTTNCDRCSNIVGVQNTPTFQAHGRDYHFVGDANGGTLHFATTLASGAPVTSVACGVDMCADTMEIESPDIPEGLRWNSSAADPFEKYSCVPDTDEVCNCSGRNKVCIDDGVTTDKGPDASCDLLAACSYGAAAGNQVVFNFTAANVIGSLINGGLSTHTVPTVGRGTVSENRTLANTGDSQVSTASCSYPYENTVDDPDPTCGDVGQPVCECVPGVDCPEDGAQILQFNASKIVEAGTPCEFQWSTSGFQETDLYPGATCRLNGVLTSFDGTESFDTTAARNITKTLSCNTGGAIPVFADRATATCLVKPKVQEN